MKTRKAWFIAYGIVVALAAAVLGYRAWQAWGNTLYGWDSDGAFAGYVAARDLPCNHRLTERDLGKPDRVPGAFRLLLPPSGKLTGTYLIQAKRRGEIIKPDGVSPKPLIQPATGGKVAGVPLAEQADAAEWLEAGLAVRVSDGKTWAPAEVIFVGCGNPQDPKTCVATLVLPAASVLAGESSKWRLTPETATQTRGWNACSAVAANPSGGTKQMEPVWRKLGQVDVPAKPNGLWTKAVDYVGPSRMLRFEATGTWTRKGAGSTTPPPVVCGPDGDLAATTETGSLSADALPGALIGKIGGSSGAAKNVTSFLVGGEAVIAVDANTQGPLFLTMNDVPAGFAKHDGKVQVTIWESM